MNWKVFVVTVGAMLMLLPRASGQQMQQLPLSDTILFNQNNQQSRSTVGLSLPPLSTPSTFQHFPSQSVLAISAASSVSQPPLPVINSDQRLSQPLPPAVPNRIGGTTNNVNRDTEGFSIPRAMLSFALDMTRCSQPGNPEADCNSNMIFSPLSIMSTLSMVLMGECLQCSGGYATL